MKKVLFRTSEENYSFLKNVIGFENLDSFMNNFLNEHREHEEHEHVNRNSKQY